jgi:HEPN domain-containing protein
MTKVEIVQIWLMGADDAWDTAQTLFSAKKYHHALFFAQLYLEKLLKALTYHLKDDHPVYTHDLTLLANRCEIKLTAEQMDQLDEITSFNVSARYPEHKQKIYQKATLEYSGKWMSLITAIGDYLKTYLSK